MRIKKISPTTPANGNIENTYGTSQTNAYSEEYVNSKLSEKLDATGTAVNSTKWNNYTIDIATENNTSTWIPVMLNEKMQHTTIQSIVDRGSAFRQHTNWSLNREYCGANPGYTFVYKNSTMCTMNINFEITTTPSRGAFLMSNLPTPKQRFVFNGLVGITPVRLYVHTDGKLYADSSNASPGWISATITYPLA